jgi:hypothetical protein
LRQKVNSNQWRNTQQVISWFGNINDKDKHSFISFDIVDFYPSISEKLLDEALAWASDLATITENDISIIKHNKIILTVLIIMLEIVYTKTAPG